MTGSVKRGGRLPGLLISAMLHIAGVLLLVWVAHHARELPALFVDLETLDPETQSAASSAPLRHEGVRLAGGGRAIARGDGRGGRESATEPAGAGLSLRSGSPAGAGLSLRSGPPAGAGLSLQSAPPAGADPSLQSAPPAPPAPSPGETAGTPSSPSSASGVGVEPARRARELDAEPDPTSDAPGPSGVPRPAQDTPDTPRHGPEISATRAAGGADSPGTGSGEARAGAGLNRGSPGQGPWGQRGGAGGGGAPGTGGVDGGPALAARGGGAGGVDPAAAYAPYLKLWRARILENLRYPPAARRRNLTGTVQIEIAIEPSGALGGVKIVESSSHQILDEAAVESVRELAPIPFPSHLAPRPLRARLPVVFDLR